MKSASPSRSLIKSVPLDAPSVESLLTRLDSHRSDDQPTRRGSERFEFRTKGCVVHMQQPGSGISTAYLVPTRNISAGGLSFLHGGFVHAETKCLVQLLNASGVWKTVRGMVVRCRFVEGRVHEVGIKFDDEICTADFCPEALKTKVLIVEDDPAAVRLTRMLMEKQNVEVHVAENGKVAVEMAQQSTYDVILMDMEMPVMDGYQAAENLRAGGYTGPIIAVTAMTGPEDRKRCLAAGCDQYLPKPFDINELTSLIASLREDPLISALRGDPSLLELIDAFVEELPLRLRSIEEAFMNDQIDQLEKLVRSLKGEAGSYGFDPITVSAANLEQATIEKGPKPRIRELLDELSNLCMRARPSRRNGG